jgi:hypothetical protein
MSHTIDIRAKLKSKLALMSSLQGVYDYEPTLLSGYPTATILLSNGTGEFADNRRNKRVHYYTIKVWTDIDPNTGLVDSEEAERISLQCLDEITTAFDADLTLSGTVNYCRPIDYDATFEIRQNAARVLKLTLETVEITG